MSSVATEVAVKESATINLGLCDSCGTKAAHVATKDKLNLSFCGHHARHNAASLLERGFTINPDNYGFDK